MSNRLKAIKFKSPLAPLMECLVREKTASGYKYDTQASVLKGFDIFLSETKIQENELPKEIVLKWIKKRPNEQPSTHQRRISLARQLGKLMVRLGYSAYVIPDRVGTKRNYEFSPRIFSREEIRKLIHAVDAMKPSWRSPFSHLILPEVYRLLYCSGFRVNEVLRLRVRDVDLQKGVITVKGGKFDKDRMVPLSLDIVDRLRKYSKEIERASLEKRNETSYFFPSRGQRAWHSSKIYHIFRKLLHQCHIPHCGRKIGPRVHDLRHTFAVHRLIQWYEEGEDLNAKLPFLVAYLGHKDFTGTQKYLHLTAELFPNLKSRMNKQFGSAIPRWRQP